MHLQFHVTSFRTSSSKYSSAKWVERLVKLNDIEDQNSMDKEQRQRHTFVVFWSSRLSQSIIVLRLLASSFSSCYIGPINPGPTHNTQDDDAKKLLRPERWSIRDDAERITNCIPVYKYLHKYLMGWCWCCFYLALDVNLAFVHYLNCHLQFLPLPRLRYGTNVVVVATVSSTGRLLGIIREETWTNGPQPPPLSGEKHDKCISQSPSVVLAHRTSSAGVGTGW